VNNLNLYDYVGKFIKIYTVDEEWFIGEVTSINVLEEDVLELQINLFSYSKERGYRYQTRNKHKRRNKSIRNHAVTTNEIMKIEELDAEVKEGIKLTLAYSESKNLDLKELSNQDNLPKRVEFGWIEK